ncbi:MAG: hypothetical protein ACR2PB_01205, partial [Desulfocapsaceae bacterium]
MNIIIVKGLAICVFLTAFSAFTDLCFASEPTPQQVQEAAHIRAVGLDMGLDKLSGEDIAKIGTEVNREMGGEGETKAMTEEQKEAINCFSKEMIQIQFYGDLEIFARLLNDEEFEKEVEERIYQK